MPIDAMPVAVVGLGNILLGDEGVGIHVVRRLLQDAALYPRVEFMDAGSAGMKLLHLLQGRKRAVLIDCALMGAEPGTVRRFRPDEVRSCKALAGFSLHEGDLLSILELAASLGDGPEDVVIFGIEPQAVEPRQELSTVLQERFDEYMELVARELSA